MPRFTRAELESFRGAEVPDLVGPGVRLVFVGINPGLRTAATQIHFGNPGQPVPPGAGRRPGCSSRPVGGVPGMTDADLATLRRARGRDHQPGRRSPPPGPTS